VLKAYSTFDPEIGYC
jgi:hypothetical protein